MPHSDFIPTEEQGIYDQLSEIRQRLSVIKRDHSKFINSKEITDIYKNVLTKISALKIIRKEGDDTVIHPIESPNKVDILIDEIFQLLSLCFVTCGLSLTAPATYASLSTVQRLLEHMQETDLFSPNDLKPIHERLTYIERIIKNDTSSDEEHKLLEIKLATCYNEYNVLQKKVDELPDNALKIMNKLIKIKTELINLITHNDTKNKSALNLLTKELESVQKQCEGIFANEENGLGEGVIKGLIDECHDLINDIKLGSAKVDPALKEIYAKLESLKETLKGLLLTRRWTLRTTDIFNYQRELNAIDNSRINGFFINKDFNGQTVLLHLLRRCYSIIYTLLESSEPVSESLQPIHNQLNTVRKCLLDLKRMGGISSIRELYPYQLKLASIDNMQVDGKFIINGQIPEGQGTVFALLAECFDITHELKMELYEKEEEDIDDTTKFKSSVIGTKALQDSNYDYNIVSDRHSTLEYDESEDNLASLNASMNESDELTDA